MEEKNNEQKEKYIKNNDKIINILIISLLIIATCFLSYNVYNIILFENSHSINCEKDDTICCIGESSILYTTSTCPYCKQQKQLFGEELYNINYIDCDINNSDCQNISVVPTWKINEKYYQGVQDIKTLAELTNCR